MGHPVTCYSSVFCAGEWASLLPGLALILTFFLGLRPARYALRSCKSERENYRVTHLDGCNLPLT